MSDETSVPTPSQTLLLCQDISDVGQTEVVLVMEQLGLAVTASDDPPAGSQAPAARHIELRSLHPQQALSNDFRDRMIIRGREAATLTPEPYTAGRLLSPQECFWLTRPEIPDLPELLDQAADPTDIPIYDPSHDAEQPSLSVVSLAQPTGPTVHFLRALDRRLRLKQGKTIAAILGKGAYQRLEQEVLVFDAMVDVIVVGDVAFILNVDRFERMFGYTHRLQQASGTTFDALTKGLRIQNLAEFRSSATSDTRMMRKLASIAEHMKIPQYKAAMTMPNLLAFIDANPHVNVTTAGTGAAREFVYHTAPAQRFKLLKLLDDDFLKSTLTQLDYEANSKSPL